MKTDYKKLLGSLPQPIITHIEHLERMRRDFVANVSHELRTPLTVIHGYLEALLEQSKNDKEKQAIFQQMHQHTVRMSHLIEDLLLLSRLENDELFNDAKKIIHVDTILNDSVKDAKKISGKALHQIESHVESKLALLGAESEIKSLFSNLIINAIKYTPAKGKITIKWYSQNETAIFSVTDTGIGIEEKHIPRITERFYRVDKARSRNSGGTGLGLAIVKHVLIRHDAKLEIMSKLHQGSTFTCIFPKKRLKQVKN